MKITSAGFQFLLHSPHAQLWTLLLQYLHMAEVPHAFMRFLVMRTKHCEPFVQERQMDLVEVLSFLLMLSTMELGQDYSTENLSPTQLTMLEDLRDYGLVWQRKVSILRIYLDQTFSMNSLANMILVLYQQPSSRRFSPTRLATTLTSSSPPLPTTSGAGALMQSTGSSSEGFIILETNYRLYAYTGIRNCLDRMDWVLSGHIDNPLQTAVLNLFVALKSRFPNLVVGSITRDSVKKALANGISADQVHHITLPLKWNADIFFQIISYLIAHAHPQMRKNACTVVFRCIVIS